MIASDYHNQGIAYKSGGIPLRVRVWGHERESESGVTSLGSGLAFCLLASQLSHHIQSSDYPDGRPLRLEFSGALYHVTARGDRREPIYEDDDDRTAFLDVLASVAQRFNWLVHAYCLMGNHYHLLIETPDGDLAQGMQQLNGVYTQYSNRCHDRVGHLFHGVSTRRCWYKRTRIYWRYHASRASKAYRAYHCFVSEGLGQPGPWNELINQVFLGNETFVDAMRARIDQSNQPLAEVPRAQRAGRARPIGDYEDTTD